MPSVEVDRRRKNEPRQTNERPGDWPRQTKDQAAESRPPLDSDRQTLVARNMGLALKLARPFQAFAPSLSDDIESTAFEGLCEAAQNWNEQRGVPFGAFARNRIIGAIKDYLIAERKAGLVGVTLPPAHFPLHVEDDLAARKESGEDQTLPFENLIQPLDSDQQDVCRAIFAAGLSQRETARVRGTSKTKVAETVAAAVGTLRAAKAG